MKKLVKTPKINKHLIWREKLKWGGGNSSKRWSENKQTFGLSGKLKLMKKLVKTLKINKLLIRLVTNNRGSSSFYVILYGYSLFIHVNTLFIRYSFIAVTDCTLFAVCFYNRIFLLLVMQFSWVATAKVSGGVTIHGHARWLHRRSAPAVDMGRWRGWRWYSWPPVGR